MEVGRDHVSTDIRYIVGEDSLRPLAVCDGHPAMYPGEKLQRDGTLAQNNAHKSPYATGILKPAHHQYSIALFSNTQGSAFAATPSTLTTHSPLVSYTGVITAILLQTK